MPLSTASRPPRGKSRFHGSRVSPLGRHMSNSTLSGLKAYLHNTEKHRAITKSKSRRSSSSEDSVKSDTSSDSSRATSPDRENQGSELTIESSQDKVDAMVSGKNPGLQEVLIHTETPDITLPMPRSFVFLVSEATTASVTFYHTTSPILPHDDMRKHYVQDFVATFIALEVTKMHRLSWIGRAMNESSYDLSGCPCQELVPYYDPKTSGQFGLQWEEDWFAYNFQAPEWTIEPNVESLHELLQAYASCEGPIVHPDFFDEGSFNKLYELRNSCSPLLLRVSLPVDPHYKTSSEVATINFLKKHTTIPVPSVIEFNTDLTNPIGFEYMVMEHMRGKSFEAAWEELSWVAKENTVKQLAGYIAELFAIRFDTIGNLHSVNSKGDPSPKPGRIVWPTFFWDTRWKMQVPRGPFRTTREWLEARLAVNQQLVRELNEKAAQSGDEDDLEEANWVQDVVNCLESLFPRIVPLAEVESTTLFHGDIHDANILVDESGNITAILDWESVPAVPLSHACVCPRLLRSSQEEKPDPATYARDEDGKLCELYWEHLHEHDLTCLKHVFYERMKELSPEWVDLRYKHALVKEFCVALDMQRLDRRDTQRWVPKVIEWLDQGSHGEAPPLHEPI